VRRRVRRLSIALTLLGLVIVSGYTGAYFWFNDAVLGRFISAQVNRSARGQFLLGHARFGWGGGLLSLLTDVPTRVVGEDYRLLDPDGREVLAVPYVEADIHLQRLIVSLVKMAVTGRFYLDLHFTRAWVPAGLGVITHTGSTWGSDKPEINIVAAMARRKKSPNDGGEFRITVEQLQLDHVNFAIGLSNKQGQTSWYGKVVDGAGKAGLVFSSREALETKDGPYFFFHVKPLASARGELKLGDFLFPLESLNAAEYGARGDVRQDLVFSATARSLGADISVEGAITDAYSASPGVRLKLDFQHGAGPLHLLPPPLREWLRGDPAGQLRVSGPFANALIEADVHGADANLEGVAIRGLSTHLRLASDGVLRFDRTSGAVAGGDVSGGIEVDLGPRAFWRARLQLKGVNPASVPQVPKALADKVAGKLDARFRLFGSLKERADHIAVDDIDGTLERIGGGRLPKKLSLGGGLEIMPERLALRDLSVGVEGLTATATGNLDTKTGDVDAQLRLDGRASAALHQFGLASDLRVDTLHGQGSLGGRWPRPKLALHLAAGGVGWAQRAFDKVEADVSLAEGGLQLHGLHGTGLGGKLEGQAVFGLFPDDGDVGRPLKEPTLSAHLALSGISMALLSGTDVLAGEGDITLSLDGLLARPHGQGQATLPALTIYGDKYQNGWATVAVGDDGWTVREIHLERKKGGTLRGSGHVGWDLTYNLKLEPKDFPIAAFPNAGGTPFDGRVAGNLTIDGEGEKWRLGGLAQLTGFAFRKAVIGDGELKFEPGGDATHVKGSAFKHFNIDGTLTTSPKFAVAVSINFRDVPLESIFPEARELVDVTGTTSGSAHVAFNFETGLSGTITLEKLLLTLAGVDEDGRTRRLSVKNRDPLVVSLANGVWQVQRTVLTSQLGEFSVEAPAISQSTIDARMRGQIGLELLEFFFRNWFDHTDGNAWVDLRVGGDWEAPRVLGQLDLSRVSLQPHDLPHRLNVTQGHVEFSQTGVRLSNFTVNMDGAIANAQGSIALDGWKPGAVEGQIDGQLSAKLLEWIYQGKIDDATGRLQVSVHLQGDLTHPRWQGQAQVPKGGSFNFKIRRFSHDLSFTTGTLQFSDYDLTLGCPKRGARSGCEPIVGLIDDKRADLDGVVKFGLDLQPRYLDVNFKADEISHRTPAYIITLSPKIRLFSVDGAHYALSGSVNLVDGAYTQKFQEMKDFVIRPRSVEVDEPFWQGDPRLETMQLNVHAQNSGPLRIDVGWARINLGATSLDISNTLSDPRLQGQVQLEEGGTITLPFSTQTLESGPGRVIFEQDKRIPDETPTLDMTAKGRCNDSSDNPHDFQLVIGGPLTAITVRPREGESWYSGEIAVCALFGRSQEDVRRQAQGGGESPNRVNSVSEGVAKLTTGQITNMISDPFRKIVGIDVAQFQIGGSSATIKLCKNYGRNFQACGQGDLGFVGGSKVQGEMKLRLNDSFNGLIRIEYLNQAIDSFQENNSRLKLEFNYRIPLGF
jgi:hypothetical protein